MATFMQQVSQALERSYETAILKLAHKMIKLEREIDLVRSNDQRTGFNDRLSIEDIAEWMSTVDKRIANLERENNRLRLRLDAEFHVTEYRDKVQAFIEKRGETFTASEDQYLAYDSFISAFGDKRRARLMELPYDYTDDDWQSALRYFNHSCAVCGRPFVAGQDYFAAKDHWIPVTHSKCPGTIPSNIVPLCHGVNGCNNRKSNLRPRVFLMRNFDKEEAEMISARIEKFFSQARMCA